MIPFKAMPTDYRKELSKSISGVTFTQFEQSIYHRFIFFCIWLIIVNSPTDVNYTASKSDAYTKSLQTVINQITLIRRF